MGVKARGTILQSLGNSEADGDEDAETHSNSEEGGDTLLSPKQASNARDTRALSARWWDESRPRRRGTIRPAPESSCGNFIALLDSWLQARGLEDALEQETEQDGFVIYRYTRVPLTSEQEGWERAFHGTRWYALWLILASGVMLESDDREAGHDFWEPGVYCSPLMSTARWYARPHVLFGDGIYHRALLELAVDTKRRKRERMRGGVQWVFPTDAVAVRAVWLEKNAPPSAEEQRFATWDPGLEALPPGWTAPEPVTNCSRLVHDEVEPEEEDNDINPEATLQDTEPLRKENNAAQPEAELQDSGPPRPGQQPQSRQSGLSTYSRLKMQASPKASAKAGAGRQPMQPSPTQAQPMQQTQPPLAKPPQSQDAIILLAQTPQSQGVKVPLVRPTQSKDAIVPLRRPSKPQGVKVPPTRPARPKGTIVTPPRRPQGAIVRPVWSQPTKTPATKESVDATPAPPPPCVVSKSGGILTRTGSTSKAQPPAPLVVPKPLFVPKAPTFSEVLSTKLPPGTPQRVTMAPRPAQMLSTAKAKEKPVDPLTATCDGIERDLAAFLGELGESGRNGAKRQKTWKDELLEDIERKKQELQSKT